MALTLQNVALRESHFEPFVPGSAAGCEARLCRAVHRGIGDGLRPRFGLARIFIGQRPN